MVGEDIGWYPLDMGRVILLMFEMLVLILIPGFIALKTIFKEITEPYEQVIFSFLLGICPIFLVALLNIAFNFPVTAFTVLGAVGLFTLISIAIHFVTDKDGIETTPETTEAQPATE